jgi:hypothetical protein
MKSKLTNKYINLRTTIGEPKKPNLLALILPPLITSNLVFGVFLELLGSFIFPIYLFSFYIMIMILFLS